MKLVSLKKELQTFLIALLIICGNCNSKEERITDDKKNINHYNVEDLIIHNINDFRNKVAQGNFEFEMSKDQKAQLATMKDKFYYNFEKPLSSPDMSKLPSGKNFKRVYWDVELHGKAEAWAKQCKKSYPDDISSEKIKYGFISKMSYFINEPPKTHDWDAVISGWIKSITSSNFDLKNIDSYTYQEKKKPIIAQLLFSDLNKIGCSSYDCGKGSHKDSKEELFRVLFVCYLFPQGPLEGKQIYDRARNYSEVGKINCSSNGNNDPYFYLCPTMSKRLRVRKNKK